MDRDTDVEFGYSYGILTTLSHALLVTYLALTQGSAQSVGLFLNQPSFVFGLLFAELFKVFVAKRYSGHLTAFSLPQYANPVRGDPSKGPFLRRTVLRIKKLIFRLKPFKKLAQTLLFLLGAWALSAYVVVCFGAPVFSSRVETASFSALLTVLSVIPSVLIYGPDLDRVRRVFLEPDLGGSDPLAHLLFLNAFGGLLGAWFGAFPIPLDWDRPWQAWPLTCCIGAVTGNVCFALGALVKTVQTRKR